MMKKYIYSCVFSLIIVMSCTGDFEKTEYRPQQLNGGRSS